MATNAGTTGNELNTAPPFPIRRNAVTDDYKLLNISLGVGINGKVYKCQHLVTKESCALKILKDSENTRREIMLHRKACENCPYIVKIRDIYENMVKSRRCLLLIMECMEGGQLYYRIIHRKEKPYTERDAARYISMIVEAITHLHKMDIAHRDLKLENLLLSSMEDDAILKLTDFGFAKEGNNEELPYNTPNYTAYYAPPEILSRTKYDKACDIWSMGVIMYMLVCGYPPFYSSTGKNNLSPGMREKIKAGEYKFVGNQWQYVRDDAKSTIKRMLTVDPKERITISEIAECSWLRELVSERTIDVSTLREDDNLNQIQTAFASANIEQRIDDDTQIQICGPEASQLAKKRAAKKKKAEKNNSQ